MLVIPERKPKIDHHAFPTASSTEVSSSDVTNKSSQVDKAKGEQRSNREAEKPKKKDQGDCRGAKPEGRSPGACHCVCATPAA